MTDRPDPAYPDAPNDRCMLCGGPARYVHPLMVCDACNEWWLREFVDAPDAEPPINDARMYERSLL